VRSDHQARLYELSSRILAWQLRIPGLRTALTWFSKVWLRQARLVKHLAASSYDTIVDGGANIGEFAALARLACPNTPLLAEKSFYEAATFNELETDTSPIEADKLWLPRR